MQYGEQELRTAVLKYLEQTAGSDEGAKSAVAEVASKVLGVETSSAQQGGSEEVDLLKTFKAGCEKLGVTLQKVQESTSAVDPAIEASPKFQNYLTRVKEKGYFGDAAEDSPEYKKKYERLVAKYMEKFGGAESASKASGAQETPASAVGDASAAGTNAEQEADKLKEEGNQFLKSKEYDRAVVSYSKAIDLSPAGSNTHIYYGNRAAAYLYLENFEGCLEDCTLAVTLNPSYARAHARASTAALRLGRTEEARKSAKRALELEPGNAAAQRTLDELSSGSGSAVGGPAGGAGGMPDMSGLANMMQGMDPSVMEQMRNAAGGAGGMPDIGSLMNNPGLMQAAQQMMSQNPQMMQMAQQMMQDPNAMANMMKMMGGMGGGGMPK
ncbi:Tetratricopeptide repeat protein 1 [Hondaea fermentalgiana]|uniref:Tetratricopeptide repeat protein 1 n=1 Tax=Hondaea fermentalgiana TaxID=2315210 RepID=A0A2R5GN66_9STRA|nr:Tetratricopeptide repeat protein 1 [Hondaea fermentalgiana]|eukprot:GBG32055.1 Tetratricopeptide repeat protein 1 [Hondaea fermentalgiana]